VIRSERARLRSAVALAADTIAPAWPLDTFVAVNPLLGFESQPFVDATARAAELFRARVLPGAEPPARDDRRAPFDRVRDLVAAIGVRDTLADWCVALGWGDAVRAIDERTGRWLAAYTDRGEAPWPMPHRERGFYLAWKQLARHEHAASTRARAYRDAMDALPSRADDALGANLAALGIPAERVRGYLARHLAQTCGWAAFIKRANAADAGNGLDLLALLAVRTWYERCELTAAAEMHRVAPTFPALRDWLLADPARVPPVRGPRFHPEAHAAAYARLEAREARYASDLLAGLARDRIDPAAAPPAPVAAQVVFCIDARSEPLRRALEAEGPYETLGFAGFFGVPLRYRPFDGVEAAPRAPVLMRPTTVIDAVPGPADAARLRASAERTSIADALGHGALLHPVAAFTGVEVFGAFAAARAARKTARPRRAAAPADDLPLAHEAIPLDERIFIAEAALRIMGLTRGFAPLVVFCAHGGGTVNNAFASAIDCGACGGNRGLINARVAAALLNDLVVRAALHERGIAIPATTRFVAAEHDTTRDTVRLLEDAGGPLAQALERAGATARARRRPTLPQPPLGPGDPAARAGDWAQTRPEWGLARNAALIVGPRACTRGIDLDARCFLHSYDPHADADGRVLEQILTAPMVVAEWINLQYFFATVDPARFGSGDKVVQQPVGGVGVVAGNGGDLRPGLPLQSTTFGTQPYHEPLRLLAVVYAPRARIDAIVARQQVLRRLFDHRWVLLAAIDPDDGSVHRYAGANEWIRSTTEVPACSPIV
jgi:uncharacterized protein YbcC (UPF0753/DUF2309 family)